MYKNSARIYNRLCPQSFLFSCVLFIGGQLSAQPFTLILEEGENGYSGVEDAALSSEEPTFANGGYGHIFSGRAGNDGFRHSTLRFDLSLIPIGTTVFGATLDLVVSKVPQTCAGSTLVSLHPISKDWNEGNVNADNRGGPAATGDVTWNSNMFGVEDWVVPGGDYGPGSATASVGCGLNSRIVWNSLEMVNDVQNWVDDLSSNFGWMVVGDETVARSARRYYSSEGPPGRTPRLTLSLDALPPVPTPEPSAAVQNWGLYDSR